MRTLYRPVNKVELDLIQELDWKEFPPRLTGQPIFYPVTNQEYASQITREWNIPSYKNGFVTAFDLEEEYLAKFKVEKVGLDHHTELWVPSEELQEFNSEIKGNIRVIEGYAEDDKMEYIQIIDSYILSKIGKVVFIKVLNPDKTFFYTSESFMIDDVELERIIHQKVNIETREEFITFKLNETVKLDFQKLSIKLIRQKI